MNQDARIKERLSEARSIFLDAGGVILDEREHEQVHANIISALLSETADYSVAQYWRDAEEAVRLFVPNVYDYIMWKNTMEPNRYRLLKGRFTTAWSREHPALRLMDGIADVIRVLSQHRRLGLLGQYGTELLELLRRERLLEYFSYRSTQDAFSLTKPDPRYFEQVLRAAGVEPERSAMIGDRIDKDIIPAKMIGMTSVRLATGMHRTQKPRVWEEFPDVEIEHVSELIALFAIDETGASRE